MRINLCERYDLGFKLPSFSDLPSGEIYRSSTGIAVKAIAYIHAIEVESPARVFFTLCLKPKRGSYRVILRDTHDSTIAFSDYISQRDAEALADRVAHSLFLDSPLDLELPPRRFTPNVKKAIEYVERKFSSISDYALNSAGKTFNDFFN